MSSIQKPSKKMLITIPSDVHKKLRLAAVEAEIPMAQYVIHVLRKEFLGEEITINEGEVE